MSQPIIEVKRISKRYQLGAIGATRLRDDLERLWHRVTRQAEAVDKDEFWALRDVSFEVQPGEIIGIIGRNGAGKSTLLKILSRITEPASGEIVLRGRVASLLEVGTGFVGDLSGRDNVFLNGAILGMSKAEIRSKFDEIVAFAEIEKFIDTPVKRYSSGMYVRLAFAVAAHLEPEILIIDEVLAVGDIQFQKKCLGKMQSVSANEGRTVLFVSHNLGVVANLCNRALLLSHGRLVGQGNIDRIIADFIGTNTSHGGEVSFNTVKAAATDRLAIRAARTISEGEASSDLAIDKPMVLEIEIEAYRQTANVASSIHLFDKQGAWVLCSGTKTETLEAGRRLHRYHFPANFFNDGRYYFNLILVRDVTNIEINLTEAVAFFVHETGIGREEFGGTIGGCVRPHLQVEALPLSP